MEQDNQQGKGLSIAAMVLGVVTVISSFIPIWNMICLFTGIAGIVCGVMGRKRLAPDNGQGLATAGLIISVVGLVLGVLMFAACACIIGLAMFEEGYYYSVLSALPLFWG